MKALMRSTVVVFTALLLVALGYEEARAQDGSGRARVLVATFQTEGSVDDDFGRDIAEQLRDRVDDFDLLVPVSRDEVEEAIDRFDLDENQMDLVSWRQLASRLNAQLIIYGDVSGQGDGARVDALFVEADRGEQTEIPGFSVPGDGGDEAEQAAQRVSRALDEHVSYLSARLNCQDYLSAGQLEDAARNCDRALEIRPNSSQALYLRGQVAVENENWQEAVDYLERSVEQTPENEGALQSLAFAHAQAGNRERSIELYRQYLEFNPDDPDVRLSVAYNLANAGALSESMQLIQAGIERDSTNAAFWKYLGDVALQRGTSGDRQPAGGAPAPGDSAATQQSAPAEGDRQQAGRQGGVADSAALRTAINAYERYFELEPDSVNASTLRNVVGAHLLLGNTQQALDVSSRALGMVQSDAERASLHSLRADIFARQEQLGRAIAAMDSVIAADETRSNAYFKRGLFKLRADRGDAMSDFRAAIESGGTQPNQVAQQLYATGHNRYYQNQRFQQAANMFEAALEFAESQDLEQQLHFWTGYSYFRIGRQLDDANQEEACQPARRALQTFQQVLPHINQAGDYQTNSQQQITQAVDVLIYRQEQIQRAACG